MKIHLDGVSLAQRTGPSTFARRFFGEAIRNGHHVSCDPSGADISLVFIEPSGAKLAKKVVQRLDGIWFKPDEFATKNVGIRAQYEKADHVIWQSDFDREMITRWFGSPKAGTVIHNGVDVVPVKEFTIPKLQEIRSTYQRVYVCSANWHPQKRLRSNIELFQKLREENPSSCLVVLGSNPDVLVPDPHIYYTGSVPPEVYMQIYSMADWMLHLAWADHCPNTVVEALSQGTPVVCSSVGGTKELVRWFGVVVDEQYDFGLFDYDNPPKLDVSLIGPLPKKHELFGGTPPDVSITETFASYFSVLEETLG